jgi:acetyl-CoA acetyltransferase family protein
MLDIAILEGIRTPFAKAFTKLAPVTAYELGRLVTVALLNKAEKKPEAIDQVVYGNVATPADAANIARVIALKAGIPQDRIAHTVQRNCASGMEAVTTAAQILQLGEAKVVIAGGTESMSQVPLLYGPEATEKFLHLARAKTWWQRLTALASFRPRHFKPVPALQLGLTDPVSGLIMGATAEVLAEEFNITRQQQDEFALESHRRASVGLKTCVFSEEITPVPLPGEEQPLNEDFGPRADQSMAALGKLKPFFKEGGTVIPARSPTARPPCW